MYKEQDINEWPISQYWDDNKKPNCSNSHAIRTVGKVYFLIIIHNGYYSLATVLVSLLANPTVSYHCCSPIDIVISCIFSLWINSFKHPYGCSFIHVYWLQYHSIEYWARNEMTKDYWEKNTLNKTKKTLKWNVFLHAIFEEFWCTRHCNSIICLEALVKFYIKYISGK